MASPELTWSAPPSRSLLRRQVNPSFLLTPRSRTRWPHSRPLIRRATSSRRSPSSRRFKCSTRDAKGRSSGLSQSAIDKLSIQSSMYQNSAPRSLKACSRRSPSGPSTTFTWNTRPRSTSKSDRLSSIGSSRPSTASSYSLRVSS